MEEKIIYEYCVLRYVPDIEREEFINIGLMMMSKRNRWIRCELGIDEAKIMAICTKADVNRLRVQTGIFKRDDVPARDLTVEERYRWLAAVKSAIIQTSPSHPGVILIREGVVTRQEAQDMLNMKFDELFQRLVTTR